LIVNRGVVSQTLNVNPKLFVIPCKILWGILNFHCYNYCHLPSAFSSITIFHHKLLTREGRVLANGWTHPSSITIFVHVFVRSVIQKVIIVTWNAICVVFDVLVGSLHEDLGEDTKSWAMLIPSRPKKVVQPTLIIPTLTSKII
jgi:hypothetical protein